MFICHLTLKATLLLTAVLLNNYVLLNHSIQIEYSNKTQVMFRLLVNYEPILYANRNVELLSPFAVRVM